MKTWLKWLFGIVASLSVIIGIGVLNQMNKQEQLKQEMVKVVESEEAKAEFEEVIKNLDPRAFTPDGTIHSYKIDIESIKHNPMGGINVSIFMNDDEKLSISYTLNKDVDSDTFLPGGVIISEELDNIISGKE